ncbi:MAG: hypothetical protein JO197_05000 [Acidobacteria bacterium]|nr:hypothetical protein [Acidobacteriota bacterium]MBV9475185.1 hypothetical protein [Acidobacteriota bacterium]
MKAVLLLLVLLLAVPVFPQCNWTPRYSGAFRETVYDVSPDAGNSVWIATGYGVEVRDADGVLAARALPGSTRVVRAIGNNVAYAGSGARLYVLRRSGSAIDIVRTLDAGGTVNDLLVAPPYFFLATSAGLFHYDFFDATNPQRAPFTLPTSSPNVTSLASAADKLYAADGDSTVEVFSIASPAFPQHVATLDSVARASSVYASADDLLFVSDKFGQSTDLFQSNVKIKTLTTGATSVAPAGPGEWFLAGPDRTLRAFDLTALERIAQTFETTFAASGGNGDNTIHRLVRSGDTLYVAAGDLGLLTLDASALTHPYPLVSYATGATTSAIIAGGKAYFTNAAGTIAEYAIDANGIALTPQRTWTTIAGATLQDQETVKLLTAAGATATLWSLDAQTPTAALTVAFRTTIRSAVLRGNTIVALLTDGSLWTATDATPHLVDIGASVAQLARSGDAIALAVVKDERTTDVRYYATGDFTAPTRTYNVDGVVSAPLALDATRAAVFTYRINVIDLGSGATRALAGSDGFIPRGLAFAGSDLLVLSPQTLDVWTNAQTLARSQPLPGGANAFAGAAPISVVAGAAGPIAIRPLAPLPQPVALLRNQFPTNAVIGGNRLYLQSDDRIDIYAIGTSVAPVYVSSIRSVGAFDIAATSDRFFTLSGSGTVTAYSTSGALLAQTTIDEGADAQPRGITTAGNAVWVSLTKGFLTGQSQKKTLVLDPLSLAVTASLNGGTTDVVTSGARAYALFSLPDEVRVLDLADPLHPAQLASVKAPANALSVSYANNNVYILADRIYAFSESTLAANGTFLQAVATTGAQLRIDGGCAAVVGRDAAVDLYAASTWTSASAPELPSTPRVLASAPGRLYVLTDHSIEVWTQTSTPPPERRHSVR